MDISFKKINALAIPALFAGIAEPLLSIVDTAFVGHMPLFAKESLAAVGIVGVFISMIIWILGQTRSAISTIVSQYLGAKKLDQIMSLPAQAIFSVLLLSFVIIGVTYPIAPYIFKLYNADNLLLDLSVEYYKIRIFGLPLTLLTFAIFGIFRGLQNTFYPMLVAIIGALINIGLDYLLIYGVEGIIPALNIRGAAYASLIAQFVMALLSVILIYKKTQFKMKLVLPLHPEMKNLSLMVLNLFIRTLALNIALYFGSSYATKYGNTEIAAYTIAVNIWFFFAFVIDGYSSAGNILSGKLIGAKAYDSLRQLGKRLAIVGIAMGVVIAIISFIFYYQIGELFIDNDVVLNSFYSIFWIVLLMQPINGVAFIFDGIFKGLGKMKFLRNVLLISTFVGFVPTLLISDFYGMKLHGIWLAFTIWMIFRASFLLIKFKKFNFFSKKM